MEEAEAQEAASCYSIMPEGGLAAEQARRDSLAVAGGIASLNVSLSGRTSVHFQHVGGSAPPSRWAGVAPAPWAESLDVILGLVV